MLFRSNDTATTEISTHSDTLSLHDALPIFAKLGLYPGDVGHRRVLAVLRYLGAGPVAPAGPGG